MPILNYTTKIPASTSIAYIFTLLQQHGATHILYDLDKNKEVAAISFRINTEHGILSFRLPADAAKVHAILRNTRAHSRSIDQARRVAWRITKDWLEAQLAMIQIGLVTLTEVFLPYAQNPETGETLYESLAKRGFPQLTLPDSSGTQTNPALRHH